MPKVNPPILDVELFPNSERLLVKADKDYIGKLVFDKPRHRIAMGFRRDWPRMNSMPEWFVAEADRIYTVTDVTSDSEDIYSGKKLQEGLPVTLKAKQEKVLCIIAQR